MPLSSESLYDELNGYELKEILLERFKALLDTVPDFQRHLTLPRVRMRMMLHLDIFGRRNPALDILDDFTVRTKEAPERSTVIRELEADDTLNADTGAPVPGTPFDGSGDPPDQIREEHNIPVLQPVRDRVTGHTQQVAPAAQPGPAPPTMTPDRLPGGRRYAAFHTIERVGPVVQGFGDHYLPGSEPVVSPNVERADPQQGIQSDFRETHRSDKR